MSNKPLVPEAKDALDKMKTEYANEIGTKLDDTYKGDLPSKVNGKTGGSIGGLLTKKMVENYERNLLDR